MKTARTEHLSRAMNTECYRLLIRWKRDGLENEGEISELGSGFLGVVGAASDLPGSLGNIFQNVKNNVMSGLNDL